MTNTMHPGQGTTAGTDVLLCALAIAAAIYVHRIARNEPWMRALWTAIFGLAALSAGLGAALHGLDLPRAVHGWVWSGLSAFAGLSVALLGVAVIHEHWGLGVARRALPVCGAATLLFYAARLGFGASDVSFRLFIAAVALFSLGGYGWLALRRRAGAVLMVAGILVSLAGMGVHLRPQTSLTLVWVFDHNGIYHVMQMAGITIMTAGLRKSRG